MSDTLTFSPRLSIRRGGRLIIALSAGLAMGLTGCDRDDAASSALREAQNNLSIVSPAQATYDKVLTGLQPVSQSGAPSQKAAASAMIAQAHAGLASTPVAAADEVEQDTLAAIVQLRALHTQFLTASAMADAAGAYDPSAELAEIDKSMAERNQELATLEQNKSELDNQIRQLETQATQLLEQGKAKRAEAAALKGQVANQTATRGEELMKQARDLDREADGLEVQSATLEAQAAKIRPDSEQAALDIARVTEQKKLLDEAKSQVNDRAAASRAEAAEARAAAQKVSEDIKALVDATNAQRQSQLTQSAEEAINRFEQAAAAAQQSVQDGSAAAGHMAAGSHQQSLGDLYWSRAQGLSAWSQMLESLTQSKPAVSGSDGFKTDADAAAAQAKDMLDKATAAYEAANGSYQNAVQTGGGPELQERIDRLNQLLAESVEITSGGSKDIRAAAMASGGEMPADGGAVVAGEGTPHAAIDAIIAAGRQRQLGSTLPQYLVGDADDVAVFTQLGETVDAVLNLNEAVKTKFNKGLIELGMEASAGDQSQAGMGAMMAPMAAQMQTMMDSLASFSSASMDIQVDGDTARVGPPDGAPVDGENALIMRNIDGQWKIDLAAMDAEESPEEAAQQEKIAKALPDVIAALNELTSEVNSDAYSSPELFFTGVVMKVQNVMQSLQQKGIEIPMGGMGGFGG